jgi:hypothetical protein
VKTKRDVNASLCPDDDRHWTEGGHPRNALLGVALFAGIVLINAILAILFIALMQALGLWMAGAAAAAFIPPDGAAELPTTLHPLTVRRASATS